MASGAARPPRRSSSRLKPQQLSSELLIEDDIDTEVSLAGDGRNHILQLPGGTRQPLASVRVSQKLANETSAQRPSSLPSIGPRPSSGHRPTAASEFSSLHRLPAIPAGRGASWPPPLAEEASTAGTQVLDALQQASATSQPTPGGDAGQESLPIVQDKSPSAPASPTGVQESLADVQDSSTDVQESKSAVLEEQEAPAEAPDAAVPLAPPSKLSLDKPWWQGVSKQQLLSLKVARPSGAEPPPAQGPPAPPPESPASPPESPASPPESPASPPESPASPPESPASPPESPPPAASPVQLVAPLPTATVRRWSNEPITERQIQALRRVLFGEADGRFSPDWVSQGFHFANSNLPYLLCSQRMETRLALSAVQAELLRQLLFIRGASRRLRVTGSARSSALAAAICAIVSRCGQPIRIVLPNAGKQQYVDNPHFQRDGVSETLDVYTFADASAAAAFLGDNVACFQRQRAPALLLLLYSCLLTLRADSPQYAAPCGSEAPLLGSDNLCSRGLLSLLLCGQPVQQVFNDFEEQPDGRRVAGVPRRCGAGLLSYREFATRRSKEPYQLGSFLKSPASPVWLLETADAGDCCLAFATDSKLVSDWRAERHFRLLLLSPALRTAAADTVEVDCRDRLSPQPEPCQGDSDEEEEEKQLHPVQMCLLSKWPGAKVQLHSSGGGGS